MIANAYLINKQTYVKDNETKYIITALVGDSTQDNFIEDGKIARIVCDTDTCVGGKCMSLLQVTVKLSEYFSKATNTKVIEPRYTNVILKKGGE